MFCPHVLVVAAVRFLTRLDQDVADSLCEIVPGQNGLLFEAQTFVGLGGTARLSLAVEPSERGLTG